MWNDPQHLNAAARFVRGAGWLLAALILVVGTVLAAKRGVELTLWLRACYAAAVLVVGSGLAWLIERYAARFSNR